MKTSAKIYLGERLRLLRGGLSQREMAANIGVPQKTYANWELGIRQPKLEDLAGLCAHFEVSADWLLGLSDARGRVTNTATATGAGAQAAAGGVIQNGDPATAAILARLASLEEKVAASSTPPRKRR